MQEWVLVGVLGDDTKVIGPFSEPDEARELCNTLGMPEISWQVCPLVRPS